MKNKRPHYAWWILLTCCCLSGAVSGMVVNCHGVFYAPAAAALGVSATTYATYTAVSGLAGVLSLPLVQRIFAKYPIKPVMLCYLLLFCVSVVGLGFAQNMYACYLFGALQGLFSSFLTLYPIAYLLKNWFVKKRGMVMGIATMFAGLFAAVMNPMIARIIEAVGWRVAYVIVGCAAFVVASVPTMLFLVRAPEDIGLTAYGGDGTEAVVAAGTKKQSRMSRRELISIVPIVVLTVAAYMAAGYNQHLPNYALTLGIPSKVGATLISMCMVGNVVSKLVSGIMNDLCGVYITAFTMMTTMAAAFFILMMEPAKLSVLLATAFLLGQATAFIVVEIPLLLGRLFEDRSAYERCLSAVLVTGALTSTTNNVLINGLYRLADSYRAGHLLVGCLLLVSSALIISLRRGSGRAGNAASTVKMRTPGEEEA